MKLTKPLILLSAFTLLASSASATLLVYEGFNYEPSSSDGSRVINDGNGYLLDGSGGTTEVGLSGTWNDSTGVSSGGGTSTGGIGDLYLSSETFSFGDLQTSGNYVRGDSNLNNDITSRTITADLSTGPDLWFSFLAENLDSRSAAQGGIVIGNQAPSAAQVPSDDGSSGLNGIAIASPNGNNWGAFAWDGTSQLTGDATISAPTDGTIRLLVGHLAIGGGTTSGDKFSFYNYVLGGDNTIASGSLSLVTEIDNVDVSEAGLDTLTVARQVNKAYDEIRIGTTLDAVTPVPEASTFALIGLSGLFLLRRRSR